MTNRFIALEGIDNAGKTSLLGEFEKAFSGIVVTKELTSPIGGPIRQRLIEGALEPLDKVLLFAADRQMRLSAGLGEHIAHGKMCIADRWIMSAQAYRGAEAPELRDYVDQVNAPFPRPALVILVDIAPELSIARGLPLDKNNYSLEHLKMVRGVYRKLADADPTVRVVDGDQEFDRLASHILDLVRVELQLNE